MRAAPILPITTSSTRSNSATAGVSPAASVDTYRSDVNYGNGIRLLASNLSIDSKDGHGQWFDEIVLSTSGLGNDPYQNASLRVQKNGLYRYDMLWREDDYYNPGLDISGGEHLMDTVRGLQDHSLTLFPESHFQVDLGYSRNTQSGPALSTVQGFDTLSSAFPAFENVKEQWNEYRIGVLAEWGGLRFIARHTWDFYKNDSGYSFTGNETSGAAADATVLQQFQRVGAEPRIESRLVRQRLWQPQILGAERAPDLQHRQRWIRNE